MTRRDAKTYLSDIRDAGTAIQEFVRGRTYEQFVSDALLQSAVERKFAVVGEALNQALKVEPRLREMIRETAQIIAFRNRIVHVYSDIDPETVWGVIERRLPMLLADVEAALRGLEG